MSKLFLAAILGSLFVILISSFVFTMQDKLTSSGNYFFSQTNYYLYPNVYAQTVTNFPNCVERYHLKLDDIFTCHFTPSKGQENFSNLPHASNTSGPLKEVGVWFYPKMFGTSWTTTLPLAIVDEFHRLGINVIYFGGTTVADWKNPITANKYSEFICYAYSKKIKVYAVTLEDPTFAFKDAKTLESEFKKFILQTKGVFDTFIVDVEPHVQHLSDPSVFLPNYMRMSLDLRKIADHNNVSYIDTVPYWYHVVIKNLGISPGLNVLGGNAVNIMDYSSSADRAISNIGDIVKDVKKPYTVSIKITPGYGDPYLNKKELEKTTAFFDNHSISFGIFESQYLLRNYLDTYE